MESFPKRYWIVAWVVVILAYVAGLFLDIMDIDASQYAYIAKEMFLNHRYLEVYIKGADYLDKPPLLFWAGALFFKLFGTYDWAFRLPSILVTVLGVYSIYRFTKIYYPETTAKLAALILASCQAFFLMNQDVRTDSILTGFVSFTFWQMAEFDRTNKLKHILLVGVGVGFAMLSKGPIGLVVPGTAFLFHYALNRDWKKILRWQYLPAVFIVGIILLPMCYGLYTQYDLHPEKVVYDLKGPSGLRFFFWTQSFGRITGDIYWDNHPDTFFLVHNFLWSFLPWSLLFVVAFFISLSDKIKLFLKKEKQVEWITTSGFLMILIFLSMSHYQLPHYTFVIHPLAAIILASFIDTRIENKPGLKKAIFLLFLFICICLLGVSIFMFGVFFKEHAVFSFALLFIALTIGLYVLSRRTFKFSSRLVFSGAIIMGTINIILNVFIYPELLTYQSESVIAKYVNSEVKDKRDAKIFYYKTECYNSVDFYSDARVSKETDLLHIKAITVPGNTWIVTDSVHLAEVRAMLPPKSEKVFEDYGVSTLKLGFLNPDTRKNAVELRYLLSY